jgi:hypothetical protein
VLATPRDLTLAPRPAILKRWGGLGKCLGQGDLLWGRLPSLDLQGKDGDRGGTAAEGVIEVECVLVFVIGEDEDGLDPFGGRGLAEMMDKLASDALALEFGMDGDVVEEDFGGFGGDPGEGEGGKTAGELIPGEGGDGPEVGAGQEALEVGSGEWGGVVFEDFGEKEEELAGEGLVGWAEAGGADREF